MMTIVVKIIDWIVEWITMKMIEQITIKIVEQIVIGGSDTVWLSMPPTRPM